MIFDGTVTPDELLVEARLVPALDMSRTPIREALHRLEAEGLLVAVPRGGFQVAAIRDSDLENLYEVRAALEGLAAFTAASRMTRVNLAQIEDLYDEMGDAVGSGQDDELAGLNREFHRAIAVASANPHLVEVLDNVKGVFERFRSKAVSNDERRAQAHAEHGELIEALRNHNPDRARQLAEEHVRRALKAGTATSE
jgi:DNA-binding GntR family transcriptional regulator